MKLFSVIALLAILSISAYGKCSSFNTTEMSDREWCRAISVGDTVNTFERFSIDEDYKLATDTKDGRNRMILEIMKINERCFQKCMKTNETY